VDICLTIFFVIWGIASIMMQLSTSKILRFNFYGYLPYCRFFAPEPVSYDTRFYVRGTFSNGQVTPWLEPVAERRTSAYFLWNPTSRLEKGLLTIYKELKIYLEYKDSIHLSFPYVKLLNIAVGWYKNNQSISHVQFMITKHVGFEDNTRECVFLSSVHKIR